MSVLDRIRAWRRPAAFAATPVNPYAQTLALAKALRQRRTGTATGAPGWGGRR